MRALAAARARVAVTAGAAALTLVITACSGGAGGSGVSSDDSSTGATGPATSRPTHTATAVHPSSSSASGSSSTSESSAEATITTTDDAIFAMPSGRISCIITATEVRCDVMQPDFEPRPEDRYPCEYDLGHSMVIVDGRAKVGCISDSLVGSAVLDSDFTRWWTKDLGAVDGQAVLPYGRTLARGHLSCTSAETGVTCSDARSGSSFELARERYELRP